MIYTWELSVINSERNNLRQIFAAFLVPTPFIVIGLGMFFSGITNEVPLSWLLGLAIFILGIRISSRLFKKVAAPRNRAYKLFQENDVFVDPPARRSTEQLALEKFNGELKPALRYIAESPELYRHERAEYIAEWYDYENDYIRELYKNDPLRVAQSSKTKTLTQAMIEDQGFPLIANNPDDIRFELAKAWCSDKVHLAPIDGDESYHLRLGNYGDFECSNALYRDTNVGDGFYIVRGPWSGEICLVYPVRDWHLDEDLLELLQ